MLKVVGASWEKTRLFSILIAVMIIVAFFAIFFYEIPVKKEDGMYAATVYYSQKGGFKPEFWGQNNDPSRVPRGVARAYYKPNIDSSGWATLEIETSSRYPDWVQAYSAGILEGSLCWQIIYWHWKNTIQAVCMESSDLCDSIRNHLKKVETDAVNHAGKSEKTEPFWHHVNLFYTQLSGLEDGWNIGVQRSRKNKEIQIDHEDFIWMNTLNEIKDIKLQFSQEEFNNSTRYKSLSFLKYLPNSTHHFLLAHESGKSYSEMLRIHKKYTFGYHWTSAPNSELIPSNEIIFTSYPGAIHSQDDYYQIYVNGNHTMTIAGTDIQVNKDFPGKKSFSSVPIGPRVMAASRLSRHAIDWAFNVNREGGIDIGGKQWVILDYLPERGSMWLVEQVPGLALAANVTEKFQEKGYWISAGIPFFKDTQDYLGGENVIDVSLMEAIKILEYHHENVTSPESLVDILKKPDLITLGRADIIQFSKGYQKRQDGIIDVKIGDAHGDVLLIAGPPYSEEVGPFRWSSSALLNVPHHGQPDLWKFEPVRPDWVW